MRPTLILRLRKCIWNYPLVGRESEEVYRDFINSGIPFTSYGNPDYPRIRHCSTGTPNASSRQRKMST